MTLLEKIKKLKWFDSISKLRDILEELYNSSSGGSGGNQDLQSVLDNGSQAIDSEIIFIDTNISGRNSIGTKGIVFDTQDGGIIFNNFLNETLIGQVSLCAENAIIDSYRINFPAKPTGTYTLATLDDTLKIDLDSRVYANNAAAITGGLTAKDLYRTSTGELRIVI